MYKEHDLQIITFRENVFITASDDGTLGGGGSGGTTGGELPDGPDDD